MRLNKSCTVANVFWSLNMLSPEYIDDSVRQVQALYSKEYLANERAKREAELRKLESKSPENINDINALKE